MAVLAEDGTPLLLESGQPLLLEGEGETVAPTATFKLMPGRWSVGVRARWDIRLESQ